MECQHKRIKKNYPYGRNSKPVRICKDCGILVTNKILERKRKKRKKTI